VALLEKAIEDFAADGDRVYCTGLSMGGTGTWHIALEAPQRFAALAPISGTAVQPELAKEKLAGVPVLIITGGSDGAYTEGAKRMWQALQDNEPKALLTVVEGAGHDVWTRYYSNPQFYEWLLKFKRVAPAASTVAGKRPPEKAGGVAQPASAASPPKSQAAKAVEPPQAPKPLPLTTGPFGEWCGTWVAAGMSAGAVFVILAFILVLPRRR
jgi:dienelactone hydrolase